MGGANAERSIAASREFIAFLSFKEITEAVRTKHTLSPEPLTLAIIAVLSELLISFELKIFLTN